MAFTEDALLMLSGIQHLAFCERQWALIHVEQVWRDNELTTKGRIMHERVDSREVETRQQVRVVRSLAVRSLELGLYGRLDALELRRKDGGNISDTEWQGILKMGDCIVTPVEYKRGSAKWADCDRVQLCAQALCLEEMLGIEVSEGHLFYGKTRRRVSVAFSSALRTRVRTLSQRMHELFAAGVTPAPTPSKACSRCSLRGLCLPEGVQRHGRASEYVAGLFADVDTK